MKLGTIGTSWITENFIEAAKLSGKLTLTSIYSRSHEKGLAFAEKHQAPYVYTSLEEMAKKADIDVVYIASPNSLHYEQVKLFMRNGKHVICEKPMFSNRNEFEDAYLTAQNSGVYLFEAVRNIHTPSFKELEKHITKIGKVRSAVLHSIQYSSRYDAFLQGEEPNVFSPAFSGGALADLGVYPLFLAVALFGSPISSSYFPVKLRNGIDGAGTLVLNYKDSVITILCSKISPSLIPSEIHGEEGVMVIPKISTLDHIEYTDRKSKEKQMLHVPQEENDMVYEIEDFIRIIKENDHKEYGRLTDLSRKVIEITEKARKDNQIVFGVEKPES